MLNPTDGYCDHTHTEAKICKAFLLLFGAQFAPLAADAPALQCDFSDTNIGFSKKFVGFGVTLFTAAGEPTWAAGPLRFFF